MLYIKIHIHVDCIVSKSWYFILHILVLFYPLFRTTEWDSSEYCTGYEGVIFNPTPIPKFIGLCLMKFNPWCQPLPSSYTTMVLCEQTELYGTFTPFHVVFRSWMIILKYSCITCKYEGSSTISSFLAIEKRTPTFL